MQIKKTKNSFNDYDVSLSWGQLMAIHAALEQNHADPIADEAFAELSFYLENVPGPGEDEEDYKAAKEAEKQAENPEHEGRDLAHLGDEVPLDDPTAEEGAPVSEMPDDKSDKPAKPAGGEKRLGGDDDEVTSTAANKLLAHPPEE